MKRFFLLLALYCALHAQVAAQNWRAVLEVVGRPNVDLPFCSAVRNGNLYLPQPLRDYRMWYRLSDTFLVNNNFAIEVRLRNRESEGGISAFDTGIYLESCNINAGINLMGAAWAINFNSIYAGGSLAYAVPELIVNLNDWHVITLLFQNNILYALYDNLPFYSLPYNGDITVINQLLLRFKGAARVDYIKLYDGNAALIWEENFNNCNSLQPVPDWRQTLSLTVNNDTTICANNPLTLQAVSNTPATIQWTHPSGATHTGSTLTLAAVTPADTGFYYVKADIKGCLALQDSVHVRLAPSVLLSTNFLGADTTLCPGATLTLGRAYPCATYRWQDGSSDSLFIITSPGIYSAHINIDNHIFTDTIKVEYYMPPQINLGNDTTLCPGDLLQLNANQATPASYRWQDGSTQPTLGVTAAGLYTVTVTDICGNTAIDAIQVHYFEVLTTLSLGNDTTLCPGNSLTINVFDSAAIAYRWQNGATNPTFTIQEAGTYHVALTDNCGNTLRDTIEVAYFGVLQTLNLGADTILCPGNTRLLDATDPAARSYRWQNGDTTSTLLVQTPGLYWVQVQDHCGNIRHDTIRINYFDVIQPVNIGSDTSICPGSTLLLNASDPAAVRYLWQDGSSKPEFLVQAPGVYAVTVTDNCGNVFSNQITIEYYTLLTNIELGKDTILCTGETLLLDVTTPAGGTYRWQDGSSASTLLIQQPGIYQVTVADNCGNSAQDEIRIRYQDAPVAAIGADTTICDGAVFRLNATTDNASFYQWQDGSTQPIYPVYRAGTYAVTVGNDCGDATYSIHIMTEYCGPCRTYVPTAFSPNGDGVNDRLEIFSECTFTHYDLRIFNRWGVQVFATTDPKESWDGFWQGSTLKTSTYVWRLVYQADDGSSNTLAGNVLLMR